MLSKRLTTIAQMIKKDKVVVDVGTDHALLPCFLVMQGISKKVYASDVAQGPLERAKQTIGKYRLENKVIPILSDGLDDVEKDAQVVVISGMGFYTIRDILEKADLKQFEQIIVQPNKDLAMMREYLSDHEYLIEDEEVVKDGFYYEIISFSASKGRKLNEKEIRFGPVNLKKRTETFEDSLRDRLKKLEIIYKKSKKETVLQEMGSIKEVLEENNNGRNGI